MLEVLAGVQMRDSETDVLPYSVQYIIIHADALILILSYKKEYCPHTFSAEITKNYCPQKIL
jgi:hypothetical protein